MKNPFKKQESPQEPTTLKIVEGVSGSKEYFVSAQSPEKALELMDKLRRQK